MVRELIPHFRNRVTKDEIDLSVHLRTNEPLYRLLRHIVESRISGRMNVAEPSNPIDCKALLARDGECRWFLNVLERAFTSPVKPPEGEHPEESGPQR